MCCLSDKTKMKYICHRDSAFLYLSQVLNSLYIYFFVVLCDFRAQKITDVMNAKHYVMFWLFLSKKLPLEEY